MKRTTGLLIGLVVLAALVQGAALAMAAQSFFGYSGLIGIPTTEVLSPASASLGGYWLHSNGGSSASVFAAEAGVFPGLEVGLSVIKPEHFDSETAFNAKFRVIPETLVTPGVAVGVFDVGSNLDTTAYAVVGKSLSVPGASSLASASAYLGFAGGGGVDGVFGGLSATVGNKLTLMVEHDTNDVNFGARFAITDQFRLHAALLGGDNLGVGVSFYTGF